MLSPRPDDLIWECPKVQCPQEQLGDMDSPFDEYRCTEHQVDLVLSARVRSYPNGRGT